MNRSVTLACAYLMRKLNEDCKTVVSKVSSGRPVGILSNKSFLRSLLTLRDESGNRPGAQGSVVVTGGPDNLLTGCTVGCSLALNALLNQLYQICPAEVTVRLSPNPWGKM